MPKQPNDHELYHDRQYPPYSPQAPIREDDLLSHPVLPYLMLAMLAFLGLWGAIKIDDKSTRRQLQTFESRPYTQSFKPSESAVADISDIELVDSSVEPTPRGEPLNPPEAEQKLSRALAELDSEMSRTERLAERVGQEEAYATLESKHKDLVEAVSEREIPWREVDRLDLQRRTKTLLMEVTKLSNELEEVASVQL